MADITKIIGGPLVVDLHKHRCDPPHIQLMNAIKEAGLTPPQEIIFDGQIHRFKSNTKGQREKTKDKNGWYVAFSDGVCAARFGCWFQQSNISWKEDVGRQLTAAEEMAIVRRMSEAKAAHEKAVVKRRETASDVVDEIWSQAQPASSDHPYLQRKGIQPNNSRVTGDGRLVVPLHNKDNQLCSLQYIAHDGEKRYHPGGATNSNYFMIGSNDDKGPIYIAEGFATAATIHEQTSKPCVAAYSASNLVNVTGVLREIYGETQELVVVADNDQHGIGQKYAEQACAKFGSRMIVPPEEGDANDYWQSGGDLAQLLNPAKEEWLIQADEFSAQPAPISWLVKGWIQDKALIMVHGPSGGGKTFVVLDWCLRMASQKYDWLGNKVKAGEVVYLAGEGHHGLRGRIAAWKHHNSAKSLQMWLSKDGCDLNTPQGYMKVVEQVRGLTKPPKLIVVDTLHRFLSGDENSAQDAKTMLDACNALMNEFGCSVVLVHHTGVSDEAQHRARGSSAWRGALDIEISIVPGNENKPMQIVQRKSKDAEISAPVFVELQSVEIPGWKDEDDLPVTSAVVVEADAPQEVKKPSKLDGYIKLFEAAWWASGAEIRNDSPYVTRAALREKLLNDGRKPRTVENDLTPSYTEKMIGHLIVMEMITTHEHGWIVTDPGHSSSMMIRKSSD